MGGLLAHAADHESAKRCVGQIHTVRGNPFTEEVKAIWRERFGAKQVGGNGYGLTEAARNLKNRQPGSANPLVDPDGFRDQLRALRAGAVDRLAVEKKANR